MEPYAVIAGPHPHDSNAVAYHLVHHHQHETQFIKHHQHLEDPHEEEKDVNAQEKPAPCMNIMRFRKHQHSKPVKKKEKKKEHSRA
jgi:hypothetical protein